MWFEPYIDKYDREGELSQSQIYWLTFRDRPVPDAKVAIHPFKRSFVVVSVSIEEAEKSDNFPNATHTIECAEMNQGWAQAPPTIGSDLQLTTRRTFDYAVRP